ncbi:MAG: voltage-gated potassium channel [Myxococcota bacterium]|jgi:voltage-gated potassium channel
MRDEDGLLHRLYRWNSFINDILLIPMFTSIIVETSITDENPLSSLLSQSNVGFCIIFFSEWLLGFLVTKDRIAYLKNIPNGIDLISTLPFGNLFQGLRIFRLARLIRLLRVVIRARRYRGKGERLLRVLSIVSATIFAGALAIQMMDAASVDHNFGIALWWSLVTVSTVGYGDYSPGTFQGRVVASVLIIFGMGVAGYLAGFMASVLADPEEESIHDLCGRIDAKLDRIAAKMDIDVSDLQAPVWEDGEEVLPQTPESTA